MCNKIKSFATVTVNRKVGKKDWLEFAKAKISSGFSLWVRIMS